MYRLDMEDFKIIMSEVANIKNISYFRRCSDGSNNILFYYNDIKLDVYVELTTVMNIYIKNGEDLFLRYTINRYIDNSKELYLKIECLRKRFEKCVKRKWWDKYGN